MTAVLGLALKKADRIGALFGQQWTPFHLPATVQPIARALIIGALDVAGGAVGGAARGARGRAHRDRGVPPCWWGGAGAGGDVHRHLAQRRHHLRGAAGGTAAPRDAEFAFLVGIPTMFAATGYELLSVWSGGGFANVD